MLPPPSSLSPCCAPKPSPPRQPLQLLSTPPPPPQLAARSSTFGGCLSRTFLLPYQHPSRVQSPQKLWLPWLWSPPGRFQKSMNRTPHSRRATSRPFGLFALLCLSASTAIFTLPSRAQDAQQNSQQVADAARPEKARKAAQQKKDPHVYTNEELKQSQILTPQDRSRVEAGKKNPPVAPNKPADPSVNAEKNSAAESLGEVARRYRRQKLENSQATGAEAAAKRQPSSRFPMDLAQPSYAAPVEPIAPRIAPNSHPHQNPKPLARISPRRHDPFSRPVFPPTLPSDRAPLAPDYSAPAKPAISLAVTAPHAPTTHATAPPTAAPKLLLPSKPILAPPSLAPRAVPVAPLVNNALSTKALLIRPGDCLWKLARLHLGSGSRWNELLAANPAISDPNRLQPGTLLVVPATELRSRARSTSITIQSGDSLWKLAASQLGSGTAWPCIAHANPQLRDANRLLPGQILAVPASCRTHSPVDPRPRHPSGNHLMLE
jgi:nucleoid-associated protein YgaU